MKKVKNYTLYNKFLLLSFFIPAISFILILIIGGIYPFGKEGLCPYDSLHQYIPFLSEYRYKLLNGESLFYTMRAGSGTDFYLIWLYYLTSPVNLVVIFFDDIVLAFTFIEIIKIGFCGLSICWYLRKKFNKNDISIFVFSLCYSLSSYVIAYYFNIMWIDSLILFPVLIYYFDLMLTNNKKYIYPLILAVIIFSNFYMSVQICIFLCLYFITRTFENIKDFFIKGLRFAFLSLLGGGIAAFSFIPFLSIMGEKKESFPNTYFLTNFSDFFSNFYAFSKVNISMEYSSGANVYCGLLILFLFITYILNKNISNEDKIKNIFLLTILLFSMNISSLDYIMHGFTTPTGYMARYSYVFIFLIITYSYESFISIKELSNKKIIISIFFIFCFVLINGVIQYFTNGYSQEDFLSIFVSLIIILIFSILYLDKKHNIKKYILLILVLEISISVIYNINVTNVSNLLSKKESYNSLKIEDNSFYREDIDTRAISNEGVFNNMNSMSFFSSTLTKPYTEFTYNLGLRGGSNYITSFGHSPVVDLVYNLKYVYNKEYFNYYDYDKLNSFDGYSVFKLKYDASSGYVVPKSLLNWDWTIKNPFTNINNFVSCYYDERSHEIYNLVNANDIDVNGSVSNIRIENEENFEIFYYKTKNSNESIVVDYILKNNNICINLQAGNIQSCKIFINDEQFVSDEKINGDIISFYDLNPGDVLKIVIEPNEDVTSGIIKCNISSFNETNFDKFSKDLISNKVVFSEFDDDKISGTYSFKEDSILLISLPYSKGWSLSQSGKNYNINDDICFIVSDLDKSEMFELKYVTPLFSESIVISIVSFVLYLIYLYVCFYNKKRNRF